MINDDHDDRERSEEIETGLALAVLKARIDCELDGGGALSIAGVGMAATVSVADCEIECLSQEIADVCAVQGNIVWRRRGSDTVHR